MPSRSPGSTWPPRTSSPTSSPARDALSLSRMPRGVAPGCRVDGEEGEASPASNMPPRYGPRPGRGPSGPASPDQHVRRQPRVEDVHELVVRSVVDVGVSFEPGRARGPNTSSAHRSGGTDSHVVGFVRDTVPLPTPCCRQPPASLETHLCAVQRQHHRPWCWCTGNVAQASRQHRAQAVEQRHRIGDSDYTATGGPASG